MSLPTLVGTPDREPSRRSTIAHAVTVNTANGPTTNIRAPHIEPGDRPNQVERAAKAAITRDLIDAAGTDAAKLRALALTLLDAADHAQGRMVRAEQSARDWERAALKAGTEADLAMFKAGKIDRAGDLIHAAHDRFPWRMCREEACRLLQEATGRGTDTR